MDEIMRELSVSGLILAAAPWNAGNSAPTSTYAGVPMQEIEYCLSCPLCADCCERCRGMGQLKPEAKRGRPPKRKTQSNEEYRAMSLRRINDSLCSVGAESRE